MTYQQTLRFDELIDKSLNNRLTEPEHREFNALCEQYTAEAKPKKVKK